MSVFTPQNPGIGGLDELTQAEQIYLASFAGNPFPELLTPWKLGYNSYMEYTEVAGNITQVNYWSDSGKGTKLFTKDITYSGANPTLVVVTDEVSGKVLTTTIAYSGEDITSVTKVIS